MSGCGRLLDEERGIHCGGLGQVTGCPDCYAKEMESEIARLRLWLEQIQSLMSGAYGNSSFHSRVAKMAQRALAGDAPNG